MSRINSPHVLPILWTALEHYPKPNRYADAQGKTEGNAEDNTVRDLWYLVEFDFNGHQFSKPHPRFMPPDEVRLLTSGILPEKAAERENQEKAD